MNITYIKEPLFELDNEHQILLLNNKVVITYFNSNTRQLFETDEGSYIYYKDTEQLFSVTQDVLTKILLKLETIVKDE